MLVVPSIWPETSPIVMLEALDAGIPVVASRIGGIPETQDMLDFCASKGIYPDVEMIRMDQVNTAYERLLKNDVRYRFVIDMSQGL